jgi:hypothetical protein
MEQIPGLTSLLLLGGPVTVPVKISLVLLGLRAVVYQATHLVVEVRALVRVARGGDK